MKVEVAALGLPVPNSPYGFSGRKATLNLNSFYRFYRSADFKQFDLTDFKQFDLTDFKQFLMLWTAGSSNGKRGMFERQTLLSIVNSVRTCSFRLIIRMRFHWICFV